MKPVNLAYFVLLTVLALLMSPTTAQATCPLTACAGWGDINFLSAACTGSDETSTIQDDFDCLRDCGGTLVFPAKGDCVHEAEITIFNGADFHIEGNGATLTNVSTAGTGTGGFAGIFIKNSHNFSIRNLILDGNRQLREEPTDDKPNHLLFLRGVEDVEVENVRAINSVGDGFYLRSNDPTSSGQDLRRVRLIACSSDNSWRHGIGIAAGEDIQILGGTFSNANGAINSGNGKYFSTGIRIETNPYDPEEPAMGDEDDAIENVLVQGTSIHDNEAAGVHIHAATDQPIENIRILGNSLSNNKRGQMLLDGRNVLVADNLLGDFSYDEEISEIAGILVMETTDEVVLEGNLFSSFDPGPLDIIYVEPGVEGFEARENSFRDILLSTSSSDTSASAPAVIRTEAANSVIAGNTIHTSDIRGLLLTTDATRSVVSGNSFYGMTLNVLYINGEDTVLNGNRIADPRGSASSAKAESVVRVRSDLGSAEGNVVECADTSQRGFLFEQNPVLVRDNLTRDCSSTVALEVEGTGTTYGVADNYEYP